MTLQEGIQLAKKDSKKFKDIYNLFHVTMKKQYSHFYSYLDYGEKDNEKIFLSVFSQCIKQYDENKKIAFSDYLKTQLNSYYNSKSYQLLFVEKNFQQFNHCILSTCEKKSDPVQIINRTIEYLVPICHLLSQKDYEVLVAYNKLLQGSLKDVSVKKLTCTNGTFQNIARNMTRVYYQLPADKKAVGGDKSMSHRGSRDNLVKYLGLDSVDECHQFIAQKLNLTQQQTIKKFYDQHYIRMAVSVNNAKEKNQLANTISRLKTLIQQDRNLTKNKLVEKTNSAIIEDKTETMVEGKTIAKKVVTDINVESMVDKEVEQAPHSIEKANIPTDIDIISYFYSEYFVNKTREMPMLESFVMALHLGYINGKRYEVEQLAAFLELPKGEVLAIITKNLKLYRDLLNDQITQQINTIYKGI